MGRVNHEKVTARRNEHDEEYRRYLKETVKDHKKYSKSRLDSVSAFFGCAKSIMRGGEEEKEQLIASPVFVDNKPLY